MIDGYLVCMPLLESRRGLGSPVERRITDMQTTRSFVGVTGSLVFGEQPVTRTQRGGSGGAHSVDRFAELQTAGRTIINTVPAISVFFKPYMSGTRYASQKAAPARGARPSALRTHRTLFLNPRLRTGQGPLTRWRCARLIELADATKMQRTREHLEGRDRFVQIASRGHGPEQCLSFSPTGSGALATHVRMSSH
jgi:hypothetical protein